MSAPPPPPTSPPPMPPPIRRDVRTIRQRLSDTHVEAVEAGWRGPIILLSAFLSSTLVLTWQGFRWSYGRARDMCVG